MRIVRADIDGYGVFADEQVGPFAEGLNVVLGENETGKSTLLDFVRGVLYGFATGTSKRHQHLPLRGGRHGGRLVVTDQRGALLTIERHGRSCTVRAEGEPDAGEATLRTLVGHTDKRVFESIFAFGLPELDRIDALGEDEVRDAIFAAGVVGAGRSASRAIAALDAERLEIARTTRGENPTLAQIDGRAALEAELEEARANARGVAQLEAELSRGRAGVDAAFETLRNLERRGQELRDLEAAAGLGGRREGLEAELTALGTPDASGGAAARSAPRIAELVARHDGYEHARRERDRATAELEQVTVELHARTEAAGMTEERCAAASLTVDLTTRAAELEGRHRALGARAERLAEEHDEARHDRATQQGLFDELADRAPAESVDELERRLADLAGLRASLVELQAREGQRALAAAQAEALRSLAPRPGGMLFALLGAVVLLGLAITVVGWRSGRTAPSVALGLLVVAAGLGGLAAQLVRTRRPTLRDAPSDPVDPADLLAERAGALASGLGLEERPSLGELETLERRLRQALDGAGEVREARRRLAAAEARLDRLATAAEETAARAGALAQESNELARSLGADRAIDPPGLVALVEEIRTVRALSERRRALTDVLATTASATSTYEADVAGLCGRLGEQVPHPDAIAATLERLGDLATAAGSVIAERERLAGEIARLDERVETILARHREPERLAAELAGRTGAELAGELGELGDRLEEARARHDEAIRAADELARRLADLQGSSSIPDLELALGATQAEITAALSRFATLGLASLLVKRTLSRYQQERQPAVIARASALFSEVTAGRYRSIVTSEEGQRPRLEVRSGGGGALDADFLSSGTAQLCYLCVRVAYAEDFATRATTLPLVFDDVLVNLDPGREAAMARTLATIAEGHQILLFTCHPGVVATLERAGPTNVVQLPPRR